MGTNWVPSMLIAQRLRRRDGELRPDARSMSAVVSARFWARSCIMRLGSRISMLTMAAGAIAGAVVLDDDADRSAERVAGVRACWAGRAASSTPCRRRCTRWPRTCIRRRFAPPVSARPSAFGRIGGVLSPSVGQMALDAGGASAYFRTIAMTMTVAFVALAGVARHIPRMTAAREAGFESSKLKVQSAK